MKNDENMSNKLNHDGQKWNTYKQEPQRKSAMLEKKVKY